MMRFRGLALGTFFKNITKAHTSRQHLLLANYVTTEFNKNDQNHSLEAELVKVAKFRRIANDENLDIEEFLVKPQDSEELESIFKEIAQGDEKVEKQLQLLLYEVLLEREENENMPNVILKKQWEELLNYPNATARKKYLNFLHKKEKIKESKKIKDALRKREIEKSDKLSTLTSHIYYGLSGYSLFNRIYTEMLYKVQDLRAASNKLFSSPIVFDCSYQDFMNGTNTKYCASQLAYSIYINRIHQYPCTLHFVNLNERSKLKKNLTADKFNNIEMTVEMSEKSYLDFYPKERLVYLTPHTKNKLLNYNDNDIYIIGAYVDKGQEVQISQAKAKENGLRMAALPLDDHLIWQKGTKSLTLNNVLSILLDLRFYRNWEKALQTIPHRNLMPHY